LTNSHLLYPKILLITLFQHAFNSLAYTGITEQGRHTTTQTNYVLLVKSFNEQASVVIGEVICIRRSSYGLPMIFETYLVPCKLHNEMAGAGVALHSMLL